MQSEAKQGISLLHANVVLQLPNGENDGGLRVLEGSFPLYKQFFDEQ